MEDFHIDIFLYTFNGQNKCYLLIFFKANSFILSVIKEKSKTI